MAITRGSETVVGEARPPLIWHLNQLKLKYSHHQQPQQHRHYDELDPFRSGVREPSQRFVDATHSQRPSGRQVIASTAERVDVHTAKAMLIS